MFIVVFLLSFVIDSQSSRLASREKNGLIFVRNSYPGKNASREADFVGADFISFASAHMP
jgi:hypothetical protein